MIEGQVALVTGAGRGIGAATAYLLASLGVRVGLLARNSAELKTEEEKIEKAFGRGKAIALIADVSKESSVKAAFHKLSETFGPVDILVNNAAVLTRAPITELTVEEWDTMMAINLRGCFLCSREAFIQMKSSARGGSIVNIGSLGGIRSTQKFEGFAAYSTSKHGIVGLTETLSVEGRPFGIRVNCVAPGAVDTKMLRDSAPFLKTETKPEDIAEVIVNFCDRAKTKALTGATIEIHSNT